MHLQENHKYQVRVDLPYLPTQEEIIKCDPYLRNLDLPGFTACKFTGRFLEVVFYPPQKVDDEFVLQTIESTLKSIGLEFTRAMIRRYVGSALKTLAGSAVGGAAGSRAGPWGAIAGILLGAVVEKALFDWENLCDCCHDNEGNLVIQRFGNHGA